MDRLVIARHGGYNSLGNLTPQGHHQMQTLGGHLDEVVKGRGKLLILTSPASQAIQSAHELWTRFGGTVEQHDEFGDGGGLLQATRLVVAKQGEAKVLIIVTHYQCAGLLPRSYGKTVWNGQLIPGGFIHHGQAWVINIQRRTHTLIW